MICELKNHLACRSLGERLGILPDRREHEPEIRSRRKWELGTRHCCELRTRCFGKKQAGLLMLMVSSVSQVHMSFRASSIRR